MFASHHLEVVEVGIVLDPLNMVGTAAAAAAATSAVHVFWDPFLRLPWEVLEEVSSAPDGPP